MEYEEDIYYKHMITRLLYFLVQCLFIPTAIAAGLISLVIAPVWWIITGGNFMNYYIKAANNIDHFIDEYYERNKI